MLWGAVLLLGLIFTAMARGVALHDTFAFDAPILTWMHAHQSGALSSLARVLSRVGDPTAMGAATALVLLVLAATREFRNAVAFAVEVGGAVALDLAAKASFARPRPTLYPHLVPESDFGFPSGHAVGDAAFFLALYLLLVRAAPRRWRPMGLLGILVALVIAAFRPYLQVHYPSDVLAGWALGFGWTLAADLALAPARARGLGARVRVDAFSTRR